MRVVVALGGNALLRRGEPLTAETQRRNVKLAAAALAPIALEHELVISHGNGPQVGLLALQAASFQPNEPYPLDVLGAQTEGMIGYMIEQELGNLVPDEVPFATILTMVAVNPDDPAFGNPTKFIGPLYSKEDADRLTAARGWTFRRDGDAWRRVVPSPEPKEIFEIRPIRWLLEKGTIVIAAGGGGIPTMYEGGNRRALVGVEAVIDKDLCSELLARQVEADLFIMATDTPGVVIGWGTPQARVVHRASPDALGRHSFPPGSMGPKVDAACRFTRHTGKTAVIGALGDLPAIVRGEKGTQVSVHHEGLTWHD